MKKYLILVALFLSACSNSGNNAPTGSQPEEQSSVTHEIEVSNLQLTPDLYVEAASVIDLGSTSSGQSLAAKLVLKNSAETPLPLSLALATPQEGFVVLINRCAASIPAKSSCSLTVSFSSRNLFNGTYSNAVEINSVPVGLTATVTNQPDPDITGTPALLATLSSSFISQPSNPVRSLVLKNEGTKTSTNISVVVPPSYTLFLNRCSTTLKPGASCQIKIAFKQYGPSSNPPAEFAKISSQDADPININLKAGTVVTQTLTLQQASGGTISGPSGVFPYGVVKTLTATPDLHYALDHWTGACSGSQSTCQVTMDSDKSVSAVFIMDQFYLTVNQPSAGGTITGATSGYKQATEVISPTFTVEAGYEFASWSGDCSGATCSLSMTQARSVGMILETTPKFISVTTPARNTLVGSCSSAVSVQVRDLNNALLNRTQTTQLNLSAPGVTFYQDSSCATSISSITIASHQNAGSFYMKSSSAATAQVSVQYSVDTTVAATQSEVFYSALTVAPANIELYSAETQQFTVSGGIGPFTWSVTGSGSINSSGLYTAGAAGSAIVKAVDTVTAAEHTQSVTVYTALSLSAGTCATAPESVSCQLSSSGGGGTLSFATTAGTVTNAGVFDGACVSNSGAATITMTDSATGRTKQLAHTFSCTYQSCREIKEMNYASTSGSFFLDPDGLRTGSAPVSAYCDLSGTIGWAEISSNLLVNLSMDSFSALTAIDANQSSVTLTNKVDNVNFTASTITASSLTTGVRSNAMKPIRISGTVPVSNTMSVCSWQKGTLDVAFSGIGRRSSEGTYSGQTWYRLSHYGYFSGQSQVVGDHSTSTTYDIVPNDSIWHHYCTTLDNTSLTAKTYRDGELVKTVTNIQRWNSSPGTALNLMNSETGTPASFTYSTAPVLDEYLVYNKVLSEAEVRIIAQPQTPTGCADARTRSLKNIQGTTGNGTYIIDPDGFRTGQDPFSVLCDMTNGVETTVVATGGTVTSYGSYRVHTFLSSGSLVVSDTTTATTGAKVDLLVVAGGGGGGSSGHYFTGGGGAGGMIVSSAPVATGTHSMTVGAGGLTQNNGQNSSAFSSIVAIGGGAGGSAWGQPGASGGSGGGGAAVSGAGGSGTSGQGYGGGYASYTDQAGNGGAGGGGGAGGPGDASVPQNINTPGAGGQGLQNNFRTGVNQWYAAGGTGSGYYYGEPVNGIGGGTAGMLQVAPYNIPSSQQTSAGVANTGSGGGGGRAGAGAAGGSGIIVIRYHYKTF